MANHPLRHERHSRGSRQRIGAASAFGLTLIAATALGQAPTAGSQIVKGLVASYDEAIASHQPLHAIQPLLQLASLHAARGETERAQRSLEAGHTRLMEEFDEGQRFWLAYVDQHAAAMYTKSGSWSLALAALARADALIAATETAELERNGRSLMRMENQVILAQVWLQMGLPDRAGPLIREALPLLEAGARAGQPVLGRLIGAYRTRASVYLATDQLRRAVAEVDRLLDEEAELFARKGAGVGGLHYIAALAFELLALQETGNHELACARFEQALSAGDLDPLDAFECEVRLARLKVRNGQLDEAGSHLERARAAIPTDRGVAARFEAFLAAVTARWSLAGGEAAPAWAGRQRDLRAAVGELVRQLAAQPVRHGGHGFWRYRTYRSVLSDLAECSRQLDPEHGARAAWDVISLIEGLHWLVRSSAAPRVTLEELQAELLDPGVGALVFFAGEETSHVFALDGAELIHELSPGLSELRLLIDAFGAEVARTPKPSSERHASAGRRLYEALVPQRIADRLGGWNTVLVVGREQLRGLRFEALPGPTGELLGLTHAVGYVPSLTWALHAAREQLKAGPAVADWDLLLLSGPVASPDYPHLDPLIIPEAVLSTVKQPFARVEERSGRASGAQALAEAERARVLHIVAHGIQDAGRELSHGILLNPDPSLPDGVVFAEHIERAGTAQVVLLSACSSGKGPLRVGDAEASTLTGAFLCAGALGVVSTSGDVFLAPTLRMMAVASEYLMEGVGLAEALRLARVQLVADGERDMRALASIHATGIVHRPLLRLPRVAPEGARPWIWIGSGLVLVFAVLLYRGVRLRRA